jgi:hypothetical protein
VSDGQWVTFNNNTYAASSTTWNGGIYVGPSSGQVAYQITPVAAAPPPPRTEVDQLLGEVEAVCALAR